MRDAGDDSMRNLSLLVFEHLGVGVAPRPVGRVPIRAIDANDPVHVESRRTARLLGT
jgi:hypothetical protein